VSEIETLREYEDFNYGEVKAALGDSLSLTEDLVDLYKLMAEICSKTSAAVQDDIFAGLQFVLACRYHLVVGALTALRGHITDSFRNSRMAIESAAFAARVKRDPGLATVWLNAGHDDAAYKQYRNQFSKLFAGDDPVLRELGSRYDDCAKQGHPSVYAFAGHTKIEQTPTDLLVQFEYFQMRSDASEPVRTYLWILTTHLLIVRLLSNVMARALEHDRHRWDLQFNSFEAKLEVHKVRWLERIPALKPAE